VIEIVPKNHGSWLPVLMPSNQGIKESKSYSVFLPHYHLQTTEDQERLWGSLAVYPFGGGIYRVHI